jgi:DNA-binding NarL/FixJ family response regulator
MIRKRNQNISVLIVDDHCMMRDGIKASLKSDNRISKIYEAENGREAIFSAEKYCPEIVLIDINLPDFNGIEITRRILKINSTIRIIGLTMHKDKIHVMGMLAAGACGFLTKTCSARELLNAIHDVFSGKIYVCDEVMTVELKAVVNDNQYVKKLFPFQLTRREIQILKLIADGLTSSEIAAFLEIRPRTVETHRQNLMDKLDIRKTSLLTKFAISQGVAFLE